MDADLGIIITHEFRKQLHACHSGKPWHRRWCSAWERRRRHDDVEGHNSTHFRAPTIHWSWIIPMVATFSITLFVIAYHGYMPKALIIRELNIENSGVKLMELSLILKDKLQQLGLLSCELSNWLSSNTKSLAISHDNWPSCWSMSFKTNDSSISFTSLFSMFYSLIIKALGM